MNKENLDPQDCVVSMNETGTQEEHARLIIGFHAAMGFVTDVLQAEHKLPSPDVANILANVLGDIVGSCVEKKDRARALDILVDVMRIKAGVMEIKGNTVVSNVQVGRA